MGLRIGVDIGGTFTDAVMENTSDGKTYNVKIPTTTTNFCVGAVDAVERLLRQEQESAQDVSFFVHGTTVITNTILTMSGAKTGLVATKGFRDILEIGRFDRPERDLYNLFRDKPVPPVPRNLRFEVSERINSKGEVLRELELAEVRQVVRKMKEEGVKSVAVCLLHSYMNPKHEQKICGVIKEEYPMAYVSASSDVQPEFREYERLSTTVLNAYVMPRAVEYIRDLEQRLRKIGVQVPLHIMRSSGGMTTVETAMVEPISIMESGPAAGAIMASYVSRMTGLQKAVSLDIGGTTAKMGIILGGEPRIVAEYNIATMKEGKWAGGYPVRIPMIDLIEIGAGGGSIIWIDAGGMLQVGPQSAEAEPGPACYGRGGTNPTVTDACVLLGYINPDYFCGGEFKLNESRAEEVMREKIAKPLGTDVYEAAYGAVEVMNANMIRIMRRITIERGYDPRDFALVAFGGAGPTLAVGLSEELGFRSVIVPEYPGIFSAYGLLRSDVRYDYTTPMRLVEEADPKEIREAYKKMEEEALEKLIRGGFPTDRIRFIRSADMRYVGQGFELNLPVPQGDIQDLEALEVAFHDLHKREFTYSAVEDPVEIINLRLTAIGKIETAEARKYEMIGEDSKGAFKYMRKVFMSEHSGFVESPCYERDRLLPGSTVNGPAVIEQPDSSTVIHPDYKAEVDEYRNLVIGHIY